MSWADPSKWTEEAVEARRVAKNTRNARYASKHKGVRRQQRTKPFVGVNGLAAGTDDRGRAVYRLFRVGDSELFLRGLPLETEDIFEHILAAPRDAILVGYHFTYDATLIVRDLSRERVSRLLQGPQEDARQDASEHVSPYTWWRDYAVDWKPGSYFRVARLERDRFRVVPGTARTVNEVSGYFRQTFYETLVKFGVGSERERLFVADMKEAEHAFSEIGQPERDYCETDCQLLADVMEGLRSDCVASDILPQQWRGPGYLAAILHKRHDTPRRDDLPVRSADLDLMALQAYMGGRFEAVRIGEIAETVREADLNSTYAAVLPTLPCSLHTTWTRIRNFDKELANDDGQFCARVVFDHSREVRLCSLPVRVKGRLLWPRRGGGSYYAVELRAALRAGAAIHQYHGGYKATRHCDCVPYDWVRDIYARRVELGSDTRGYPLKIALAALYGKFVQRLGSAPWRDYIAAGLTTATVRAWLIDAYRERMDDVVMIASDAIYSTGDPLPLSYGNGLGQWEPIDRFSLFVVQPGLYWSPGFAAKTRGIPRSAVIDKADQFEGAWRNWLRTGGEGRVPYVPVTTPMFTGHRQALAMGDMRHAGKWRLQTARVSFAWNSKRGRRALVQGDSVITRPLRGSFDMVSELYDPDALTEFQRRALEDEAAPDFVPWGNQGE